MSDDLGAIDEDVPFDWGGATALIAALEAMATAVEDQRATRSEAAAGALVDWQGQAVGLFVDRLGVGDGDAVELAAALRDAAEDVRALERAAREEQERREAARTWRDAYEENERDESAWNKFTDWVGGEDFEMPPMPPPPTPEPNLAAAPGVASDRG